MRVAVFLLAPVVFTPLPNLPRGGEDDFRESGHRYVWTISTARVFGLLDSLADQDRVPVVGQGAAGPDRLRESLMGKLLLGREPRAFQIPSVGILDRVGDQALVSVAKTRTTFR